MDSVIISLLGSLGTSGTIFFFYFSLQMNLNVLRLVPSSLQLDNGGNCP